MSVEEQAAFLAVLGHKLTVIGRFSYETQGEGVRDPQLLRGVNEIHHRLYAQLRSLLVRRQSQFDAESMVRWLVPEGNPSLHQNCLDAFEEALRTYA